MLLPHARDPGHTQCEVPLSCSRCQHHSSALRPCGVPPHRVPDAPPALPPWLLLQAAAPRMTHNDKVGDLVCMEEARWVLNVLYDALAGQVSRALAPYMSFCSYRQVAGSQLEHCTRWGYTTQMLVW